MANRPAIESWRILLHASARSGIVLVWTKSSSDEASMFSTGVHNRASGLQRPRRIAQGIGGIDQVIYQDAGPLLDVTDDVLYCATFAFGRRLSMIIQPLSQGPSANYAANIRRHDHQDVVLLASDVAE